MQFCCRRDLDPLNPSVSHIINFLSETFHRGVGYDCINTARGALSSLGIVVDGYRAGNHPLVNRLLRGVFNLRPSTPRYADTWDVAPVLQQLRTMAPVHTLRLKELTLKLVMLMSLTQAARVQTLHLLVLKHISIGEDSITLRLGGSIKQCRPKCNIHVVKFQAYAKDPRLCVLETLKLYIEKTQNLRPVGEEDGQLFISYVKPHKPVSKDTIARWVRTMLIKAGVDTSKYTAGSVRPAAASKAKAMAVPVAHIMARAGWSRETTFARHYNKVITPSGDVFQDAVLC